MGSNKEAQAARNAADRRLREKFPQVYAILMRDEHEKRGLTWNRRATPEERAERERLDRKAKARARIEAEASKAGLEVTFREPGSPVQVEEPEDFVAAEEPEIIGTPHSHMYR